VETMIRAERIRRSRRRDDQTTSVACCFRHTTPTSHPTIAILFLGLLLHYHHQQQQGTVDAFATPSIQKHSSLRNRPSSCAPFSRYYYFTSAEHFLLQQPISITPTPITTTARWAFSDNQNKNEKNDDESNQETTWIGLSERTKGIVVLLTVPLAWGTYGPVVKYLYEIKPAVPGFVFSACYYLVASLTTLSIVSFQQNRSNNFFQAEEEEKQIGTDTIDGDETMEHRPTFPIAGGIELGLYLFLGNCLQVIGLKTVSSDRAGFLVQLTTVMVPVTEALLAGNLLAILPRTWISCLLAFCGICVMNLDGMDQESIASMLDIFKSFSKGDVLILSAAVLYTLHVVRLGRYAKETTPMKLAASKATVETILSTSLVVGLMSFAGSGVTAGGGFLAFVQESGMEISNFFSSISKSVATGAVPQSAILSALGATLWTGLVTCAYTIFAQSYGQKRVGPSEANLIYSVQPICTALFAFLLLGETMGPAGVVGGIFIGAAVYLVTMTTGEINDEQDDENDENDNKTVKLRSNLPEISRQTDLLRNSTEVLVK